MAIKWLGQLNALFSRNRDGDIFYDVNSTNTWNDGNFTNLEIAENHPILTPALLFVSKLFSQAEFHIENKKTQEKIYEHPLLELLKKPNIYQTQNDFLESLGFGQIAQGKAVVYVKRDISFKEIDSLYLLDPDLIKWPDNFKAPKSNRIKSKVLEQKIIYDEDGENLPIKIKDLLFLYDLPNCLNKKNPFENGSRLDGLKQTLINTKDSLLAKNIILKTNGKELISAEKGGHPFSQDEKAKVEGLYHNKYGLGKARKRGIITKATLNWQSLHIALRDLGLDESVKVDGNLIYTALHIPKDILSLEAKKTTYNNFKESMVSYIQNEMQSTIDAFTSVFQSLLDDNNIKLVGSYEHLPIMQFILIEKYDGVAKRGLALKGLREAGIPDDVALDLCGFEKNVKLNPLVITEPKNPGDGEETE